MTYGSVEPLFLHGSSGRLFVLLHHSKATDRCTIFVPPFAEEMNLCRRQMTESAHRLVQKGYSALFVDLYGTGDSGGDFDDASWSCWKRDIALVIRWATDQGLQVDALVATRLGCSLAAESLGESGLSVSRSVFWQPIESGEECLRQFLRLKVAASMARGERETVKSLKARLHSGETLEIAGYRLSPALSGEIDGVRLRPSLGYWLGHLNVLEVRRGGGADSSSTAKSVELAAQGRGLRANSMCLTGEPFWATSEIVVNSQLRDITIDFITEGRNGGP